MGLGLVVASALAQGQAAELSPDDAARRRDLITQAQDASTAGDHLQALTLLDRAGRMRMTPSLRRFIADEQLAAGQLVRALASAEACVREDELDPTAVNRDADLPACRALVEQTRPRIGHVLIHSPEPAPPGLRITVGGSELNPALWGVAFAVDPGNVVIDATASGGSVFHRELDVAPGATLEVVVSIPAGPVATPPAAVARPSPTPAAVPTPLPPTTTRVRVTQNPTPSVGRALGGAALGVAAATLGVGIVANVLREQDVATFNTRDAAHQCQSLGATVVGTSTCADEASAANTAQAVMIVGYVAAGAFAVAGTALLIAGTRPSAGGEAHAQARFGCGPGPGRLGVACAAWF